MERSDLGERMSVDCPFCAQAAGELDHNEIAALIDEPWAARPVLAELGGAVAIPSIGALAPGHTLICPAEHYRSSLACPRELREEISELTRLVRGRLESATQLPTHVFEHGSPHDGSRIACSIEHAHVHVLPADIDVRERVATLAEWIAVKDGLESLRAAVGNAEYLFYEAPTGERAIATTTTGLPSQLLRRVFAEALGLEEWNWRIQPAVERMRRTAELMSLVPVA
jgi:diadenosine tetraphosphate (Ap4A) HIT family hydrolase